MLLSRPFFIGGSCSGNKSLCHHKSIEIRLLELEDGTFYNPPSLQDIYHQNCFECHPPKRENDAGEEELACDKCHKEDEEE